MACPSCSTATCPVRCKAAAALHRLPRLVTVAALALRVCRRLSATRGPVVQEEGNIPYVIDNGAGAFETDPARIADILSVWLGPERRQCNAMAASAKALGRPDAVYKIVRDLAELCEQYRGATAASGIGGEASRVVAAPASA